MKKTIISLVSAMAGAAVGAGVMGKTKGKVLTETAKMSDKHLALFLMMNQWVKVKQEGKQLSHFFKNNGYKKIAIYGMSYAGETLIEELKETEIEIAYGIDKKADSLYSDIDVFSMEDLLEEVDVIVVTAITFYDEIEEKLSEKVKCPIVSLEDILYEV